ncbi:MAG: 4-aminobutyrate aminotransferase [Conexibacter sp.]|nr:4-aminobutyrate aminotransferase [Conexibacter sp.]MDX6731256.1 hypothetical protein [Baekduia sp.]
MSARDKGRADPLLERRARLLGPAYRLFYSRPLHIVKGEGTRLYDADGVEYLDAYNNVACVGHCHPRVVEALTRQAATLNTHTRYLGTGILDYAEQLLATFPPPLDQVMLTCSGSEANDLACRLACAATGASGFIVTGAAYHGVTATVAALSPSLGPGVALSRCARTVPAPSARWQASAEVGERFGASVREAIAALAADGIRPAALLVDTLFASDGLRPDPPGFLGPAVAAIRDAGGLFIADEVQAGFGRTGSEMWGFARHGLIPDLVTLGKPMGNGHPIAGVVGRSSVLAALAERTRYFNTFGGNPVSCAVGAAVLDVIRDEGLLANVLAVGASLAAGLRTLQARHQAIVDVRAAGLFAAVEIGAAPAGPSASERARGLVDALRDRRVLVGLSGPDDDVLKIRPPLVFTSADADILLSALDEALIEVA